MQDNQGAPTADSTKVLDAQAHSDILLRAEIGFWRQLLESAGPTVPAESMERMQQALALAEYRLLQLLGKRRTGKVSSIGPESTSDAPLRSLH